MFNNLFTNISSAVAQQGPKANLSLGVGTIPENRTVTIDMKLPEGMVVKMKWGDGTTSDITGAGDTIVITTHVYSETPPYLIEFLGKYKEITYLDISNNSFTGDLSVLAILKNTKHFDASGNDFSFDNVTDWSGWNSDIYLQDNNMTSTEVDNALNSFVTGNFVAKTINLSGTNEPRTTASDDAATQLETDNIVYITTDSVVLADVNATNAETALVTPTYDGSGQAVHPDVYYNASSWNSYKYWMVMTPYPGSNESYENPSIIVSNDGNTWGVPTGLTNPLYPDPVGSGHNLDPDIFMGLDGKLWIIFVTSEDNGVKNTRVMSSSDGINWSAPTVIITHPSAYNIISPAVVIEDGGYTMWAVDISSGSAVLKKRTATTPDGTWSEPATCILNSMPAGRYIWHMDVSKYGSEYHMLLNSSSSNGGGTDTKLTFAISSDGINWSVKSTPVIEQSASNWDNSLVYRGTMVLMGDSYDIWYSGYSSAGQWRIGRTILHLTKQASVLIEKTADKTTVSASGDVITYTYKVTNNGDLPLTGIVVTDDKLGVITMPADTLAVGAFIQGTASYTVIQGDIDLGSDIVNEASVSTTEAVSDIDSVSVSITVPSSLSADLVLLYELDEESGTVVTDETGVHDGTNVNALVNQTGKINKAYYFNGSSAKVTTGITDQSYRTGNVFTISVWINHNFSGTTGGDQIIGKCSADSIDTEFVLRQNGTSLNSLLWFVRDGSTNRLLTSNTDIIAGTWYHIVAMHTGTEIRLYRNGVQVPNSPIATNSNMLNLSFEMILGYYNYTAGVYYKGLLDQTAVWKRALTDDEIIQLYNLGNGLAYANW